MSTTYGTSITATPLGLSKTEIPLATPFKSGTCANTLFACMMSARMPFLRYSLARSKEKKEESVGMPFLRRKRIFLPL